jgi:lipopolysaccharide export system permease protein
VRRPFAPLCRIDRYLLALLLPRMAAALGITLVALVLERVLRLFDFVTGQGSPLGPVFGMALSLVPHYLGLALPVAFCIGVLGVVARLSEDNEIDALEGAGWSLRRIGLPFVAAAAFLALVSLALFGFLQPYSRYAYYELKNDVLAAGWDGRIEGGVVLDLGKGMLLSAETVDATGRTVYGVFLLQGEEGRRVATTAQRGIVLPEPEDGTVTLVLLDGRSLLPDGQMLAFDRLVVPREFDLADGPFRPRGENARELTLPELWGAIGDAARADAARFAAEFHERLIRAVSLVGVALFAVPLGVARKRSPRWPRLAIAIAALAIFDNLIKFATGMAAAGGANPAGALWGLALAFNGTALALWIATPGQGAPGPVRRVLRLIDREPGRAHAPAGDAG